MFIQSLDRSNFPRASSNYLGTNAGWKCVLICLKSCSSFNILVFKSSLQREDLGTRSNWVPLNLKSGVNVPCQMSELSKLSMEEKCWTILKTYQFCVRSSERSVFNANTAC